MPIPSASNPYENRRASAFADAARGRADTENHRNRRRDHALLPRQRGSGRPTPPPPPPPHPPPTPPPAAWSRDSVSAERLTDATPCGRAMRMKPDPDIKYTDRCATVQAGLTNIGITNEVSDEGFFTTRPSSQTRLMIGGNVKHE